MSQSFKTLVLGAGHFGTCLAHHLGTLGHQVTIWTIDDDVADSINKKHRNPKFLSDFTLSSLIKATTTLNQNLFSNLDAVVIALPAQALRSVLLDLKGVMGTSDARLICAAKGIDVETLELPYQIINEIFGQTVGRKATYLSGPSFAIEIMQSFPTAVSVASLDEEACKFVQNLMHSPNFRTYRSLDPVGVCVAGALKNVIAIASGAASGIGLQENSRASLVTRGLAEMMRVGAVLGANPLTFVGLAGVGDLFLTCSSSKSRNFKLGYELGKGKDLTEALEAVGSVAEGYYTTKAIRSLSEKIGVSTPICDQVFEVLYRRKKVDQALQDLTSREPKAEIDFSAPKTAIPGQRSK